LIINFCSRRFLSRVMHKKWNIAYMLYIDRKL